MSAPLVDEILADEADDAADAAHRDLIDEPAGYVLTIVPVAGQRFAALPDIVRLRRLLKRMRRGYGFRCTDVRRTL
jgi:hypothetical protein